MEQCRCVPGELEIISCHPGEGERGPSLWYHGRSSAMAPPLHFLSGPPPQGPTLQKGTELFSPPRLHPCLHDRGKEVSAAETGQEEEEEYVPLFQASRLESHFPEVLWTTAKSAEKRPLWSHHHQSTAALANGKDQELLSHRALPLHAAAPPVTWTWKGHLKKPMTLDFMVKHRLPFASMVRTNTRMLALDETSHRCTRDSR